MTESPIARELAALADPAYQRFQSKLIPTIDPARVLGVRAPALRRYAREMARTREDEARAFMSRLPHALYEEDNLHGELIGLLAKMPDEAFELLDAFLPHVDNWATCDMLAPACIARERAAFRPYICRYLCDGRTFVRRFALTTLLHFYVTREELPFVLDCLRRADTGEYYVSMAAAWLTAEVLIKFFEEGAAFLRSGALSRDTFLRSVRKACESFRLSDAQKALLRAMRADCHANA